MQKIGRLFLAAAASPLTWVLLGFLGVCIAEQPRAADHVISLVEQGHLPLGTPLRWHGHLRDEPTRLPWGYGYEIELSSVAFEDALQATRGGLRLGIKCQDIGYTEKCHDIGYRYNQEDGESYGRSAAAGSS